MKRSYTVWEELRRMQDEMDKLFTDLGRSVKRVATDDKATIKQGFRRPRTDIHVTETTFIATVELPGLDKQDIAITHKDGGLEIIGEQKTQTTKNHSGFYQFIRLPDHLNTAQCKASHKNGVLDIKIPIAKKGDTNKRITIE